MTTVWFVITVVAYLFIAGIVIGIVSYNSDLDFTSVLCGVVWPGVIFVLAFCIIIHIPFKFGKKIAKKLEEKGWLR